MQTIIDFKSERIRTKQKIGKTETLLRRIFTDSPQWIELKKADDLIRHVWDFYGHSYRAESILRCARKLRATGEFDTVDNQTFRANQEASYHSYFNN